MNAPTISLYIITFHVSMGRSASLKLQSNGDSAVETRTGRGQLTGNLVDHQGKVDERAATSVCHSPGASNAHGRHDRLYTIAPDYSPEGSSAGSWYGATYECFRASAALILFFGLNTNIFSSKSRAGYVFDRAG